MGATPVYHESGRSSWRSLLAQHHRADVGLAGMVALAGLPSIGDPTNPPIHLWRPPPSGSARFRICCLASSLLNEMDVGAKPGCSHSPTGGVVDDVSNTPQYSTLQMRTKHLILPVGAPPHVAGWSRFLRASMEVLRQDYACAIARFRNSKQRSKSRLKHALRNAPIRR